MYKKISTNCILRVSDNAIIPAVTGNKDYNAYLQWVSAGNTPILVNDTSTTSIPDISKFQTDLSSALGGILYANELAKAYPLFTVTLNNHNWGDLSILIDNALVTSIITIDQYNAIKSIALENNIPLTIA